MSDPDPANRQQRPGIFARRKVVYVLLFLVVCGLCAAGGWIAGSKMEPSVDGLPKGSIRARPGPWGDLYSIPFTIAAPDELLPVRTIEANGTHWLFKNFSRDDLARFLQTTGLTAKQMDSLLDPAGLHFQSGGIDMTPDSETLLSLSPDSRKAIYQCLLRFPENNPKFFFLNKATLQERFAATGLSRETIALFKMYSCELGNYVVVSGLPSLLAQLPDYNEKVHVMKALTMQKTMLLRLRLTPDADINALSRYWGRGCYATDVHTILESISKIKGGGEWVNILMVMPPLPSAELYDYPLIPETSPNGQPVVRDCHWTSLNFFREAPDPKLGTGNTDILKQEFEKNYYPISGDPIYGDVVLFERPDGSIIHSAVYLADDIVFTKNGIDDMTPWMLSTVKDLLEMYSYMVEPDQKLKVVFIRNKNI